MEICKKERCTGCTACQSVCPKDCISMQEDELGHLYAQIDETKCISCDACRKICPSMNVVSGVKPAKAYAAISKDVAEYKTSTSGGAAAVLSMHIVENGGVVYGCTGTNGMDICHVRIDNVTDLYKLKGSKYVQSRMGDTYKQIAQDLKAEKTVLFIGTPCQVAGAKRLFEKYEHFYAVDLICHGVPSQKLLEEHLQAHMQETPEQVAFREADDYCLSAMKNGKVIFRRKGLFDLYITGFLKGLYFRKSCYNCLYANEKRVSDLTIGDFWGVKETKTLPEHKNGLSVILVNHEKGERLLSACGDAFYMEEHPVEEAITGNAQLRRPSHKHENTEKFRMLYPRIGFKKAAKRCLLKNRIKYAILAMYLKMKGK